MGAPASPQRIDGTGDVECLPLADLEPGDPLDIGFAAGASAADWIVVDGLGREVCRAQQGTCVAGEGPLALVVFGIAPAGAAAFDFQAVARRIARPQGCVPFGLAAFSFTAPALVGTVTGPLAAECFTFTRPLGSVDGTVWLRVPRTSGTLDPRWRVFGPTGAVECTGTGEDQSDECRLRSDGPFLVIVDSAAGTATGTFALSARETSARAGCGGVETLAFSAEPLAGAISSVGEVDCFSLSSARSDDRVDVSLRTGRWTIVDGNGTVVCRSVQGSTCALSGAEGWALLVFGADGDPAFTYRVAVRRLNAAEACAPLDTPGAWAFTARAVGTTISASRPGCLVFDREAGAADASLWVRVTRTTGTLEPRWRLFGPTGDEECRGGSYDGLSSCLLRAAGRFTIVVDDEGDDRRLGDVALSVRRLDAPTGCATLPSIASGIRPVVGRLSFVGEVDCYRFDGSSGDQLRFALRGAAERVSLLAEDGTVQCDGQVECTLDRSGPTTLLVQPGRSRPGGYVVEASCANEPCGQSDTAVADVAPRRLGTGASATALLRGRDLELLEGVRLIREGEEVVGALGEPAPDGRSTEVDFDLTGAALGAWALEARFSDGTVRTLVDAVEVEGRDPARIGVELIGREAFRAGRPTTVTVAVSNRGNVDGIGVPVVLSGIPTGSVIEPAFSFLAPRGSVDDPQLVDAPFDQARDAIEFTEGLAVPVVLGRVPAGRTVALRYRITPGSEGRDYVLGVRAGQCLGGTAPGPAFRALAGSSLGTCAKSLAAAAVGMLPFGSCVTAAPELGGFVSRGIVNPLLGIRGEKVFSAESLFKFGLDAGGCALDFTAAGGLVKRVVTVKNLVRTADKVKDRTRTSVDEIARLDTVGGVVNDCYSVASEALLPQQRVESFDPNDIIGPVGSGRGRYVTGDSPLDYEVLFENVRDATAPAQRIRVVEQLDTSRVDPASVRFRSVVFGAEAYRLPYPAAEIDQTMDLRPGRDMLVQVRAQTSAAGLITWDLQAIDPETLAPPEDPLVGFLPPNRASPEGEGAVAFSVSPRAGLASGATIDARASIVFDENAPIETPTWTNRIDRAAPSVSLTAVAGAPGQAVVTWSGTDDAAGIESFEISVSRDGGGRSSRGARRISPVRLPTTPRRPVVMRSGYEPATARTTPHSARSRQSRSPTRPHPLWNRVSRLRRLPPGEKFSEPWTNRRRPRRHSGRRRPRRPRPRRQRRRRLLPRERPKPSHRRCGEYGASARAASADASSCVGRRSRARRAMR